ncbi:MAG: hypothetical protein C0425_02415 [Chlorobiaceae bacterium]|nr:hypothetical protein [Chlorobiaceae bacterium]MBA4309174.1 hypothetical protein [Chlorobiaceae bacterium]
MKKILLLGCGGVVVVIGLFVVLGGFVLFGGIQALGLDRAIFDVSRTFIVENSLTQFDTAFEALNQNEYSQALKQIVTDYSKQIINNPAIDFTQYKNFFLKVMNIVSDANVTPEELVELNRIIMAKQI